MSKSEQLISCLEGEIVKRDARIAELEECLPDAIDVIERLRAELAALKTRKLTCVVSNMPVSSPGHINLDEASGVIFYHAEKKGVAIYSAEFVKWAVDNCNGADFYNPEGAIKAQKPVATDIGTIKRAAMLAADELWPGEDNTEWLEADELFYSAFVRHLAAAPVVSAEQQWVADALRSEAEQCMFVLREIGSTDADDITGDDIEVYFEDEEGRDTGCDVSIVDYAERAAKVIESMLAAAPAAFPGAVIGGLDVAKDRFEVELPDYGHVNEQVTTLTERQQKVIGALETICRHNFVQYKESCNHLYQGNVRKLSLGDEACVYGNGSLTFQTGRALGIEAGSILSTFKALERKGLVMREKQVRHYQCALYWWPVGLAAKLSAELYQEAKPCASR